MSLRLRPEVDLRDMARVSRVLNGIDKDLIAELRSNMRGAMGPIAKEIAKASNADRGGLSGALRSKGRTRWEPVKGTVAFSAGRSRTRAGWKPLVAMEFYSGTRSKGPAGYFIAEMAGSRNPAGTTASGAAMIARLNMRSPGWSNGGRFVYRAFQPFKHAVYQQAKNIIAVWTIRTNRELEKL